MVVRMLILIDLISSCCAQERARSAKPYLFAEVSSDWQGRELVIIRFLNESGFSVKSSASGSGLSPALVIEGGEDEVVKIRKLILDSRFRGSLIYVNGVGSDVKN